MLGYLRRAKTNADDRAITPKIKKKSTWFMFPKINAPSKFPIT